jgi:hypothetical protein
MNFVLSGCSLDGIYEGKILEVKCPYMLRDHEPDSFDKLTKKQQASYCLIKDKDGRIGMRRKHKYFMQIQMQMAVTGYPTTTFLV